MNPTLPDSVEIDPPGEHRCSVIWLHGLGADGHDFEPIVAELRLPEQHGIRFVFPHAPHRPVTINGGMRMRAWYDIADTDIGRATDTKGIEASAAIARALIEREAERGVACNRIVLAGFSQGGAIALHAGLRHPQRLAGLLALSAYLPLAERLPGELAAANRLTPILQAHGAMDPVIAIELARASRDAIAAQRPAPEWREYPMAHAVCPQEIADIREWLLRVTEPG